MCSCVWTGGSGPLLVCVDRRLKSPAHECEREAQVPCSCVWTGGAGPLELESQAVVISPHASFSCFYIITS